MKFTETEEYILSNLPNGSDIGDDIREFGIGVVDVLANKLFDEAQRLKNTIETQEPGGEGESKALRQFIGHALNLQRMKRTASVKQLLGIQKRKPGQSERSIAADEPISSIQGLIPAAESEDEASFMKRSFEFMNAKNKTAKPKRP